MVGYLPYTVAIFLTEIVVIWSYFDDLLPLVFIFQKNEARNTEEHSQKSYQFRQPLLTQQVDYKTSRQGLQLHPDRHNMAVEVVVYLMELYFGAYHRKGSHYANYEEGSKKCYARDKNEGLPQLEYLKKAMRNPVLIFASTYQSQNETDWDCNDCKNVNPFINLKAFSCNIQFHEE